MGMGIPCWVGRYHDVLLFVLHCRSHGWTLGEAAASACAGAEPSHWVPFHSGNVRVEMFVMNALKINCGQVCLILIQIQM